MPPYEMNLDLAKLANACKFTLIVDKNGRPWLKGKCALVDKATGKKKLVEKTLDLGPIFANIKQRLDAYEAYAKGQAQGNVGAGGGGSAVADVAYAEPLIQGWMGNVFSKARSAVDKVSDSYRIAMDAAERIGKNEIVQTIYEEVVPLVPYGPQAQKALEAAKKATELVKRARDGYQDAKDKIANVRDMAEQGLPAARKAMGMFNTAAKLLKQRSGYVDDRDERAVTEDHRGGGWSWFRTGTARLAGEDDEVAGWLFNQPYRDPVTAATQMSPSIALRYLYNAGMGR